MPPSSTSIEVELGGVDRGLGEACLLLGGQRRGLLVDALDRGRVGRRSEAREVAVGGRAVGRLCGAGGKCLQPLVVGAVARGDPEPAIAHDLDLDDVVLDQRRLVHLGRGEARHSRALVVDDRLRLVALGRAQRALGQLERRSWSDADLHVAEAGG